MARDQTPFLFHYLQSWLWDKKNGIEKNALGVMHFSAFVILQWLGRLLDIAVMIVPSEKGEREKRERNVVIVGLNETDTNTEEVFKNFLESKLNIAPPGISQCRRLGQAVTDQFHPQTILVSFNTVEGI